MSMELLRNRIDLEHVPFTDRGSRILLFCQAQRFSLRLAERWERWQGKVGHYRQRPPLITELCLCNDAGVPLKLDMTSYPYVVTLLHEQARFDWLFIDPETLMLRLPAGRWQIQFQVSAERAQVDRRGGTFHGKRNVAYSTDARLLSNHIERLADEQFSVHIHLEASEGTALLLNITPRLAFNRSIPYPALALSEAQRRWDEWFERTPPVLEPYRAQTLYAWWIMRAGLVNTRHYFTREALYPSKVHYVGVWHWDQVFHALAYRHIETRLAEDQLRIVLDHQRENGMLPDAIHDEGLVTHLKTPVDAEVTKPPIMTWALLKLFESAQHLDFLSEIYDALTRWNRWWMQDNMSDLGLCQYQHPFSSGLDDNPLWDSGMPVIAPDLNTYMILQNQSLAKVARLLGIEADAQRFEAQAEGLSSAMMRHMWDADEGLFRALHHGKFIPVITPFSLLPLLTGSFSHQVNERLISHLTNPQRFWTDYPIPTVALDDPHFNAWQMWRGPTWININYFFVEALKRCGRFELAAQLRRKTLDLLLKHADIYEYYHPLTGEHPPKAAPMFGWSAALMIELALDETQWQNQHRQST